MRKRNPRAPSCAEWRRQVKTGVFQVPHGLHPTPQQVSCTAALSHTCPTLLQNRLPSSQLDSLANASAPLPASSSLLVRCFPRHWALAEAPLIDSALSCTSLVTLSSPSRLPAREGARSASDGDDSLTTSRLTTYELHDFLYVLHPKSTMLGFSSHTVEEPTLTALPSRLSLRSKAPSAPPTTAASIFTVDEQHTPPTRPSSVASHARPGRRDSAVAEDASEWGASGFAGLLSRDPRLSVDVCDAVDDHHDARMLALPGAGVAVAGEFGAEWEACEGRKAVSWPAVRG